jgi:hypothetical protein
LITYVPEICRGAAWRFEKVVTVGGVHGTDGDGDRSAGDGVVAAELPLEMMSGPTTVVRSAETVCSRTTWAMVPKANSELSPLTVRSGL